MPEYREVSASVEVPRNTGVDGLLYTIREILKRPRVQTVTIDARGTVTYKRFAREDEEDKNIGLSFEGLSPADILRNGDVQEVPLLFGLNAAVAMGKLFDMAGQDQLHPTTLVSGAASIFWVWYRKTTGLALKPSDEIYGLPFLRDRGVPDTALILCAAYGRDAALVDTKKAYKIEMEAGVTLPNTTVEIL